MSGVIAAWRSDARSAPLQHDEVAYGEQQPVLIGELDAPQTDRTQERPDRTVGQHRDAQPDRHRAPDRVEATHKDG